MRVAVRVPAGSTPVTAGGSLIIPFYRSLDGDRRGRLLRDLHTQSLYELEHVHDYIQWLFPLPEPSAASSEAPVLTEEDIRVFHEDEGLRARLLRSLLVMLNFYGLAMTGSAEDPIVRRSTTFPQRSREWLSPSNHNFLRLTRILRSLSLLGCEAYARALLRCLEGIYADNANVIGQTTLRYWQHAVEP